MVLTFVAIRAASLHHVDVFISNRLAGIHWNALLEIGRLIVVLAGAGLRMLYGRLYGRRAHIVSGLFLVMILRLSRPTEGQFGLVQVLRGFAASWVVLFHAHAGEHIDQLENSIPTWITKVIVLGENGVAIFFALSGFVIAHSVNGAKIDLRYAGRFALRRSIRLDPPYWISIGVVLVFGFVSAVVKSEGFAYPSPGQLFAHAFYAQTLAGYQQINVVYWTLCDEV